MNALNPIYIIVLLVTAFVIAKSLLKSVVLPSSNGRYNAIDGLRGYAAFFVFIHHASVWLFYLKDGAWTTPPSNLYTHLGQTSVAFFFMITGFLFCTKIMNSQGQDFDWLKLFISRLLRLCPLYFFSISVVVFIALCMSGWHVQEPLVKLIAHIGRWYTFTLNGNPDINMVENTSRIIAGVNWSLKYEWIFYALLPAIGLLFKVKTPLIYVLLSVAVIAILAYNGITQSGIFIFFHFLFFVSGAMAAVLNKKQNMKRIALRPFMGVVAMLCIAATMFLTPTAYSGIPFVLLTIAFCIMALGNNLFGIMTHTCARYLGEISYSLYLNHGIILFIVFHFIIGYDQAKNLAPHEFWLVIFFVVPVLMFISHATFTYIESKPLKKLNMVMDFLRSRSTAKVKTESEYL
jgi:peptidoglycan/LPS O-acetylase OafA/YrhL